MYQMWDEFLPMLLLVTILSTKRMSSRGDFVDGLVHRSSYQLEWTNIDSCSTSFHTLCIFFHVFKNSLRLIGYSTPISLAKSIPRWKPLLRK